MEKENIKGIVLPNKKTQMCLQLFVDDSIGLIHNDSQSIKIFWKCLQINHQPGEGLKRIPLPPWIGFQTRMVKLFRKKRYSNFLGFLWDSTSQVKNKLKEKLEIERMSTFDDNENLMLNNLRMTTIFIYQCSDRLTMQNCLTKRSPKLLSFVETLWSQGLISMQSPQGQMGIQGSFLQVETFQREVK